MIWAIPASAIEVAGKTMVTKGKVRATSETTQERKLRRRAPIYDNDVVTTGKAAKAQIRMSDGGMIALKENSELIIADYEYSEGDGQGSVVMELVKGGLRSVTGAIKADTGDYKLKTPVGSIGIRGTHYELEMVGTELFIAVWDGAIDVSVDTGALAGETLSYGQGEDYSYASIDEEGNVTEFLEPPANFESGMSSETDDSEANSEEEEEADSETEESESDSEQSSSEQSEEQSGEESEQEQDSESEQEEQSEEESSDSEQQEEQEQSEQQDEQQEEQQEEQGQTDQQSDQEQSSQSSQEETASVNETASASDSVTDAPASTSQSPDTTNVAETPSTEVEQSSLDTLSATEVEVVATLEDDIPIETTIQEPGDNDLNRFAPETEDEKPNTPADDFNDVPDVFEFPTTGTFTYDSIVEANDLEGQAFESFEMSMTVNFATLGVDRGSLRFNDDTGQWRGSFSGRFDNDAEKFDLKFSHASHNNNLAEGEIFSNFLNADESIIGNFTLQEIINQNVRTGGNFIIRR